MQGSTTIRKLVRALTFRGELMLTSRQPLLRIMLCALSTHVSYSQNLDVSGTVLGYGGGNILMTDIATKQTEVVAGKGEVGVSGYIILKAPNFSPGGRKICFIAEEGIPKTCYIYTADNDGGNPRRLCQLYHHDDNRNTTWCTNGYIYWSENVNAVYRVNTETGRREVYWDSPNIEGYGEASKIEDMTVSLDGTVGAARGSGQVSAFDLVNKKLLNYGRGGCSGWISPQGDRIVHPHTCCVSAPDGITSYLQCAYIEKVSDRTVYEYIIYAPGQPNGAEKDRFEDHRFAANSNNHVVCVGRENNDAKGAIVYDIRTNEWVALSTDDFKPRSMWIGTLPDPGVEGPVIALSPESVTLGDGNLSASVDISNTGSGALGSVEVAADAPWLSAAVSGLTVTISADPAGLPAGTHRSTVSVSGGGASNTAIASVTLNVGTQLASPVNISAVEADGVVLVRWTDETGGEDGFAVELSTDGGGFEEIGSTAADAASYTDSPSGPGVLTYRVRAFAGSDYSGYSDEAQVILATGSDVTLTSPTGGETLAPGSTVNMTWTADNVSAVIIELSTDGGKSFTRITSEAAVFDDHEHWADYPWTVPDVSTDNAIIKLSDYNDESVNSQSGNLTIGASAVRSTALTSSVGSARRTVRVTDLAGRRVPPPTGTGLGSGVRIREVHGETRALLRSLHTAVR